MADPEVLDRAVGHALSGDWSRAHSIVQNHEDDLFACWIHAVLHKIEGDSQNSLYWYRKAGRPPGAFTSSQAELLAIRSGLAALR